MLDFPTVMALEPLSALWPSFVVAFILTLYRKSIDKLFTSTAAYYAQNQIDHIKPQWIATLLQQSDTLPATNANGLTRRQNAKCAAVATPKQPPFDTLCKKKRFSEICHIFSSRNIPLSKPQRRALKSYHKACNEIEVKIEKFLESLFKVSVVTSIAIYGFFTVNVRHDFFLNHRKQWPPYPAAEPYRQKTDAYLLWYYILSIGYHIQRTFFQWHNPGRKDFVALVIHHWSTIICLLFSYLASFLRTGSLVIFIHENSDIFLESAKISNYCGWSFGKELFFGLFVLSWFVMRIWAFSYKVLYEIVRFGSKQLWIENSPLFFNWTCVILLFVIEGLHIYWAQMIIRMLIRKWRGDKFVDIRSETESGLDDS